MRAQDIIQKKRDGKVLTKEEISFFIDEFTQGVIPDYQMSAFLMASYFRSMTFQETLTLTECMLNSGKKFDFSHILIPKIDKHSTGGVGDKTSLILAPIVACHNIAVPMISGRGLGHTGGTVDKLESIPGFNMHFSFKAFEKILEKYHLAMMGQTQEIAPADAKMYALRDVTATVESIPLIAASIMSKKLAEGIDGLVLDVKFGNGAFMQKFDDAVVLATWLVKVGKAFGKKTVAILSDMNQPLGNYVGNSLEVEESMNVLKGNGPKDLTDLSVYLSAYMLLMGKKCSSLKEGISLARKAITSGNAFKKFQEMVKTHGGNLENLPKARFEKSFLATTSGYIKELNARYVGVAACLLGCGRNTVKDIIDPSVGFILHKKRGDKVKKNEPLLTIKYNHEKTLHLAMVELKKIYLFSSKPVKVSPLIKKVIGKVL